MRLGNWLLWGVLLGVTCACGEFVAGGASGGRRACRSEGLRLPTCTLASRMHDARSKCRISLFNHDEHAWECCTHRPSAVRLYFCDRESVCFTSCRTSDIRRRMHHKLNGGLHEAGEGVRCPLRQLHVCQVFAFVLGEKVKDPLISRRMPHRHAFSVHKFMRNKSISLLLPSQGVMDLTFLR